MIGRVVIVGAGQGGFQVAASLRQEGFAGEIVLVGDEPGLPYQRPPLSKAYLKDGGAERLLLRPQAFYEKERIDLRPDIRVQRIDRERRLLHIAHGGELAYDKLVLATGARNRPLPVPGADQSGLVEMRTLADAAAVRQRLPSLRHAIVVGGGFIGLEFAAVARSLGIAVTVIEAAPRVMSRVVSRQTSEWFHAFHGGLGVDLRLGSMAAGVLGEGRATGVRLADGGEIAGDMVVVAVGVVPNEELAREAGLECDNGIVVDELLRTGDPDIHAIGDCVSFVPAGRQDRLRLESVQNGVDGARAVAATLAGRPTPLTAVPWFWSDQASAKLQIAGLTHDADAHETVDRGDGRLCVLCYRGGVLAGVETVNVPADHMAARRLLAVRPDVTPAEIRAAGYRLKDVALTPPA